MLFPHKKYVVVGSKKKILKRLKLNSKNKYCHVWKADVVQCDERRGFPSVCMSVTRQSGASSERGKTERKCQEREREDDFFFLVKEWTDCTKRTDG